LQGADWRAQKLRHVSARNLHAECPKTLGVGIPSTIVRRPTQGSIGTATVRVMAGVPAGRSPRTGRHSGVRGSDQSVEVVAREPTLLAMTVVARMVFAIER
jgi:hypothetical protein